MKRIKKVMTIIAVLALVVSLLAGCGSSNTGSSNSSQSTDTEKPAEEGAQVAIILKTLANPYWVTMKEGIEAEAKAQGIKVDIFAVQSEDDIQGQLKLFEDCLSKNYKAIGFAPISPVNLIPAISEAYKKGIYMVNIDEKVDMNELKNAGANILAFVTTDNVKVGEKAANFIIEKLGAEGGEVAIIEGKSGAASGEDRKKGATDVFKANSAIKLVASQPADWDRIKALDTATNIMQAHPDIKAFYCANDTMALGVLEAVQNAKKDILVVGTDGVPEAVQSVKDGKLAATVAQDPAKMGATSLQILTNAIKNNAALPEVGKDVEVIPVDSILITK
jgi:D-allose transport system substrate-binding protein